MKLLFLDIDGVLNSYRTDIAFGNTQGSIDELDPVALNLIRDVVDTTGCVICLSSSWRFTHSYEELGKRLHLPILFDTGEKELDTRGDEIQKVIDAIQPDNWAILDDEGSPQQTMNEDQTDNFVKVSTEDGVSYQNYLDLIEILK